MIQNYRYSSSWEQFEEAVKNLKALIEQKNAYWAIGFINDIDILMYELEEDLPEKIVKEPFVYNNARRRISAKKAGNFESTDTSQESKNIAERAIEFLTKWNEIQDINEQVQFAAVIAAKIDKLKKTSFIQSNEAKKKICPLLRNVIRLNVTDDVFSREQIDLLKKGFLLLAADDTQKEDLLQLNRELRKEKLITMPAWE